MPSIIKSTFMLAMAATAIGHPLQSRNTLVGMKVPYMTGLKHTVSQLN